MTQKLLLLSAACMTIMICSCRKLTPAGFWKNFQAELIKNNISDQGPYGGHRAMYWKTETGKKFNSKEIMKFATKNGWTLIESLEFNQAQISKWAYNNAPIFPLTHKGFSNVLTNNSTYKYFPRWTSNAITVYKFKTGWVTIDPGTDKSIEENGFVILNNEGTEMSVYHLWGE
jgi:hypothetical protein